jgi:hypothetical protein
VLANTAMGTGQNTGENLKIVGTQTLCFDDGRTVERYLVRDIETGDVFARKVDEIPGLARATFSAQAETTEGGLTPWMTRRLPRQVKQLDFHLNSYADEHRAYFNQMIRRLINPLRPDKKQKPKLRIRPEVIDPVYREGAMYAELMDDGVNMIYTHPEDLGLPEDLVGRSFGMASSYWDFDTYTYRGGDVAFSAKALEGGSYDRLVSRFIHEFGHIFGYYHTGWIEDVMSYVRPWYRWEYFWDPTNFAWDTSWLKDKMVYSGRRKDDGIYRATVDLLPPPDSVIGMEYLRVRAPEPYLGRHVLFLTTLKGYRDRPMRLTLYRGTEVQPSRKIVSIDGYHPNFDQPEFAGLLANYNTSILYFTRQKDFKKLKKAVKKFGERDSFYEVLYSRVLRVTAVIEGYRGPNDPEPVTQTRTVRFAYRAKGEFW